MAAPNALPRILLALAATGGLAIAGYWYFFAKDGPKAPEVSTVVLSRGDVTMVVTASGDLQPVNTVEVSSQVSGLIKQVLVDFNSPVKQGDVLARLDPATYEQKLKQADADFASTTASNTLQKLNTVRIRSLFEKGMATVQERDQADALLAQSEAALLTRRASVEDAKVNLSRCTIYAPMDGIVMQRAAEVGKTVAASLNAPTLFIIANELAKMQIVAAVAEADIGNVELNQNVNFRVDAYPNRHFKGKVVQIRNYPKTASNVVTYETIIEVNNEDLKLKPGMTANVEIVVAQRRNVLKVVNSALRVRVPEEILVKKPEDPKSASAAPAAKNLSNEERRKIMAEIFQQVGYSRDNGTPPTQEMISKIQELAKQRGIEWDPSRMSRGNRSAEQRPSADSAPVTRTLYRLVSTDPKLPQVEAVPTKLGISDSMSTEIIDGLNENDQVVTSVISTSSSNNSSANPMMPFGGGNRGPGGGGAGMRR